MHTATAIPCKENTPVRVRWFVAKSPLPAVHTHASLLCIDAPSAFPCLILLLWGLYWLVVEHCFNMEWEELPASHALALLACFSAKVSKAVYSAGSVFNQEQT